FAPHLLRALRVLDRDCGERAERDQELEVVVREGVRRGEVVHVEDAEDLLVRSDKRRAHGAAHVLDQDRLALEALVGGRVVGQDATRSSTTLRAIELGTRVEADPPLEMRGTSSPVPFSSSRIETRSTFITSLVSFSILS